MDSFINDHLMLHVLKIDCWIPEMNSWREMTPLVCFIDILKHPFLDPVGDGILDR